MAARFLPHRVPAYADAFLSSHLPGPTVPLHHRAGPQSLHRNCGKIVFDFDEAAFKKDTRDAICRISSRLIQFNQTFLKVFEFFSSFQCLFPDTPLRRDDCFVLQDDSTGEMMFDEVFHALSRCLAGLAQPFRVPGTDQLFKPKIFITILAYSSIIGLASHQVSTSSCFKATVGLISRLKQFS